MPRDKNIPPKLAKRILLFLLRDDLAEEVQGDLEELRTVYDREVADGKRMRAESTTLRDRIEELRRTIADRDGRGDGAALPVHAALPGHGDLLVSVAPAVVPFEARTRRPKIAAPAPNRTRAARVSRMALRRRRRPCPAGRALLLTCLVTTLFSR